MITLKNVNQLDGTTKTITVEGEDLTIDASHLTLLPGLIDPHVHFRVPGQEYKEDWVHAARAAIKGGYTTVFDMPNNIPPCVTQKRLVEKKQLINSQLDQTGIPLRYELYFGADKNHFDEIHAIKQDVVGIKVFMGSSTGELLMDDDSSLHAVFALAKAHNLLIALHAEDEAMLCARLPEFADRQDHLAHSEWRTPEVALSAVKTVILLSKMYNVRAYILHVSTMEELDAIKQAKAAGVKVFAETTPHHLFLNTDDYDILQGRAQVNPPLRDVKNHKALFEAIEQGVIDTIGSDHAPHTSAEKDQVYGKTPSGVPGIETTLPLLLNAHKQGLIRLEKIADLTHNNVGKMFDLPQNDDFVLVDLNKKAMVEEGELKSKCGWSPFAGRELTGWPQYVYVKNKLYDLASL